MPKPNYALYANKGRQMQAKDMTTKELIDAIIKRKGTARDAIAYLLGYIGNKEPDFLEMVANNELLNFLEELDDGN